MAETERFALHFQIPSVLHCPPPQFTIVRELRRRVGPVHLANLRPQRDQLFDQRLQRLADPTKRGRALLGQLTFDSRMLFGGLPATHTNIVAQSLQRATCADRWQARTRRGWKGRRDRLATATQFSEGRATRSINSTSIGAGALSRRGDRADRCAAAKITANNTIREVMARLLRIRR